MPKAKNYKPKGRTPQFSWFGLVLYPHEDEHHKYVLDYIKNNTILYDRWCAVEHNKDRKEEAEVEGVTWGDPSSTEISECGVFVKSHTHVLVHTLQKMTCAGFVKRWQYAKGKFAIVHAEGITDYVAYCQYMAHIDFTSVMNRCKVTYSPAEFIGTPSLISACLDKTIILSNWQALAAAFERVKEIGLGAFCEEAASLPALDAEKLWNIFSKFQGVLMRADNARQYEVQWLMRHEHKNENAEVNSYGEC